MMAIETRPYDTADYLDTPERIKAYLEAVLEDGDPAEIRVALGTVARARGMSQIARETGLGRESLYKALSREGNPELGTILQVLKTFGLRLSVKPAAADTSA